MTERRHGIVQVYYGYGKGKTTAALGQAWRAMGRGLRVCFLQFLKPPGQSGEQLNAAVFGDRLFLAQYGRDRMAIAKQRGIEKWWQMPLDADDRAAAEAGIARARQAFREGCDVVVLDEFLDLAWLGLYTAEELLAIIQERPPAVELIVTGHELPDIIAAHAELITQTIPVKHPMEEGMGIRKGIDL